MINHGLNLQREHFDKRDTDWEVLGGFDVAQLKSCIAEIQQIERDTFLPEGELQFGREDFMTCATLAPINILETKFNYLLRNKLLRAENAVWLMNNGYITPKGDVEFSNRYIGVLSGTTQRGNSLKAPLESIRKEGLIPKSHLPANEDMTWAEYHDVTKITSKMKSLGREFNRRFTLNYERVYSAAFTGILEHDMIDAGGYAWPRPIDGEYPRVAHQANHAFMIYRTPAYYVFDNYLDIVDADFVKKLKADYQLLDYGYRVYISDEKIPRNWLLELIHNFFDLWN